MAATEQAAALTPLLDAARASYWVDRQAALVALGLAAGDSPRLLGALRALLRAQPLSAREAALEAILRANPPATVRASLELLPDFWSAVSKLNPLVYVVNAFRYGVLGVADVSVGFAFAMLGAFTLVAFTYSMYLLNSGTRLRQ